MPAAHEPLNVEEIPSTPLATTVMKAKAAGRHEVEYGRRFSAADAENDPVLASVSSRGERLVVRRVPPVASR